jgi:allophanate hydrolase subunit 2/allophanate hydrolase subunit 1
VSPAADDEPASGDAVPASPPDERAPDGTAPASPPDEPVPAEAPPRRPNDELVAASRWRWRLVGDDALLVDLPDDEAVARVGTALRAAPPEGVVDVVPAARTVLVRGSARGRGRWSVAVRATVEGTEAAARHGASRTAGPGAAVTLSPGTSPIPTPGVPRRTVEIPVVYDGADLADVARLTGLTVDEVVARHAASRYRVAFGGFMPGFAYLTGLDPALVVPRLATPRTRVPAGAVAIAGEYAAVYPRVTPGGWRLLGRTDAVMFDAAHDDRPALLAPGDEVRFAPARELLVVVPVGGDDRRALTDESGSRGAVVVRGLAANPGAALEVLATGPLVLVEDAGRPGLAAVGVPRSGAADPAAFRAANRLVGNRPDAAALEVVLGGLVVRFGATTAFALVGAPAEAELDGRAAPFGQAVRAPAGATLVLGVPQTGLRTWLAVRGGIDAPVVLCSRSTDVLSALGPPPVAAGDVLQLGRAYDGLPEVEPPEDGRTEVEPSESRPVAPASRRVGVVDGSGGRGALDPNANGGAASAVVVLPATIGPRIDRLAEESRARLATQEWVVTASSNRVALRLDGPPLARADDEELPSEGIVLGAVQVPHDGRPVVFGPDHPVTGGYPVVAVLTAEGIALAAQCRAGDRVRLAVRTR